MLSKLFIYLLFVTHLLHLKYHAKCQKKLFTGRAYNWVVYLTVDLLLLFISTLFPTSTNDTTIMIDPYAEPRTIIIKSSGVRDPISSIPFGTIIALSGHRIIYQKSNIPSCTLIILRYYMFCTYIAYSMCAPRNVNTSLIYIYIYEVYIWFDDFEITFFGYYDTH